MAGLHRVHDLATSVDHRWFVCLNGACGRRRVTLHWMLHLVWCQCRRDLHNVMKPVTRSAFYLTDLSAVC